MEIVSDSCVLQDKGYLFALFDAFTLTTYIPVTISKSPVLSCPLSLVQHGLVHITANQRTGRMIEKVFHIRGQGNTKD